MPSVSLRGVHVEYQLLSVRDYNLKNRVVQTARRKFRDPVVIDALKSIDLDISEGSRLGLVGPNGAGKSTLLSVMAGLLPPTRGSVRGARSRAGAPGRLGRGSGPGGNWARQRREHGRPAG